MTISYALRNPFTYSTAELKLFSTPAKERIIFTITAERAQFDFRNSFSMCNFQTNESGMAITIDVGMGAMPPFFKDSGKVPLFT